MLRSIMSILETVPVRDGGDQHWKYSLRVGKSLVDTQGALYLLLSPVISGEV